jgi:hypothetical protein
MTYQLQHHKPAVIMALSYVQASEPENWSDRDANGTWSHAPPPDSLWLVAISEKQDLRYSNNQLLRDLAVNVRIQEGRPASTNNKVSLCVCIYLSYNAVQTKTCFV